MYQLKDKVAVVTGASSGIGHAAARLFAALGAKLVIIKSGGHLNGSSGWHTLPECLDELLRMTE